MARMTTTLGMLTLAIAAAAQASGPATIFLLTQTEEGPQIEPIAIGPDETRVFPCTDPDTGVFDLIFPPGPGQSAGLVTPGSGSTFIVRHTGDEVHVESRAPGGETRVYPSRTLADLARHDIRVNVTGKGHRAAFLIEEHQRVRAEIGPVANMFAGRVPAALLEGAYVVQTETYAHRVGAPVTGRVALEMDRWPFVRVTLPNGTESDFLVDIGAATTVIDRRLLPDGVEIRESSMVEYSTAGMRHLKYAPGGATGQVQSVLGHAGLTSLQLGAMPVPEVTVTVLEEMPDLFGRPVGGIIGLDILRRAERLEMNLGDEPYLLLGAPAPATQPAAIEIPVAMVGSHLVAEADSNGIPVHFVLDTGAPESFLDVKAADALGVAGDVSRSTEARGLDEGRTEVVPGTIGELTLGDRSFSNVPCQIAALSAFNALRNDEQHIGLLGNEFFARFSRIELDYGARIIRFYD